MPTISIFYGIIIQMYFNDHAPPHFHVRYAEHTATISIDSGTLLEGHLPARALNMVSDWTKMNRSALLENWNLCQNKAMPNAIRPLD